MPDFVSVSVVCIVWTDVMVVFSLLSLLQPTFYDQLQQLFPLDSRHTIEPLVIWDCFCFFCCGFCFYLLTRQVRYLRLRPARWRRCCFSFAAPECSVNNNPLIPLSPPLSESYATNTNKIAEKENSLFFTETSRWW